MYESRIKELSRIKKEKAIEIEQIRQTIAEINNSIQIIDKQKELEFAKLQQLNMKLRIKVDEHNKAAWIIEEYEKMQNLSNNIPPSPPSRHPERGKDE